MAAANDLLQEYKTTDRMIVPRPEARQYILSILNRQAAHRRVLLFGERGCGKKVLIEEVVRKLLTSKASSDMQNLKPLLVNQSALDHQLINVSVERVFPEIFPDALIIIEDLGPLLIRPSDTVTLQSVKLALRHWLFSGPQACIAAVTSLDYQLCMVTDDFWQQALTPFLVQELTAGNVRSVLTHWQTVYQRYYQVVIPDRLVDEIIDLGPTLLKNHAFPLCGIELLEAIASSAVIRADQQGPEEKKTTTVLADDLYEQLSHLLRIPVGNYLGIEEDRVLRLKKNLSLEIIGQERALNAIVRAVQQALLGTKEPGHAHPLGIYLFMGPTGVGKTESARALSRLLFGLDQSIMINMPEFQDPLEGIKRLRGAALAYPINDNPFSVIILDEIEKSPQRIREFFLNIFDQGTFKDINEKTVDASNTFFIMTSNVGSELFEQSHGILPETFSDQDYQIKKSELLDALKKEHFRPEFINRIDEIVLFKPLLRSDIVQIIDSNLNAYARIIEETEAKKVDYDFGIAEVLAKGCDLNFGARDARRIIRRNIYSHILRTTQYYQAGTIEITRSELLRSMDMVSIVVLSKSEKDGISLVLNLNQNRYNLKIHRFDDLKVFGDTISTIHFDIVLLHSSITQEGTKHSTLGLALNSLKKIDHRAAIYIVVDAFQTLNTYKPYISQGVRSLLRAAELETWLASTVAELKQRKSITQLVDFNYENLVWKQHYNEKNRTLSLVLESFGHTKR